MCYIHLRIKSSLYQINFECQVKYINNIYQDKYIFSSIIFSYIYRIVFFIFIIIVLFKKNMSYTIEYNSSY